MSRLSLVKSVLALVLVVYWVPGWLTAQEAQRPKNTLIASSDEVKRLGVVSYRVYEAVTEGQQVQLRANLIGPKGDAIGEWKEVRSLDGDSRETELNFEGHRVISILLGKQARLLVDGTELLSGTAGEAMATVTDEQAVLRVGYLLELLSRVRREVQQIRKLAEQYLRDWNQASFAPRALRPLAVALAHLLPAGQSLHAAAREEGPGCSTEATECGDDFDEFRSQACQNATDEASGMCSDWRWCLGCCSWGTVETCDCACAIGDFFCWCVRCGAKCIPLPE